MISTQGAQYVPLSISAKLTTHITMKSSSNPQASRVWEGNYFEQGANTTQNTHTHTHTYKHTHEESLIMIMLIHKHTQNTLSQASCGRKTTLSRIALGVKHTCVHIMGKVV